MAARGRDVTGVAGARRAPRPHGARHAAFPTRPARRNGGETRCRSRRQGSRPAPFDAAPPRYVLALAFACRDDVAAAQSGPAAAPAGSRRTSTCARTRPGAATTRPQQRGAGGGDAAERPRRPLQGCRADDGAAWRRRRAGGRARLPSPVRRVGLEREAEAAAEGETGTEREVEQRPGERGRGGASCGDAAAATPPPPPPRSSCAPAAARPTAAPCVGEFTPLRPSAAADRAAPDLALAACRAGDLVIWKPPPAAPAAAPRPSGGEVVYTSPLPDVAANRRYAAAQLARYAECARRRPVARGEGEKRGRIGRAGRGGGRSSLSRRPPLGDGALDAGAGRAADGVVAAASAAMAADGLRSWARAWTTDGSRGRGGDGGGDGGGAAHDSAATCHAVAGGASARGCASARQSAGGVRTERATRAAGRRPPASCPPPRRRRREPVAVGAATSCVRRPTHRRRRFDDGARTVVVRASTAKAPRAEEADSDGGAPAPLLIYAHVVPSVGAGTPPRAGARARAAARDTRAAPAHLHLPSAGGAHAPAPREWADLCARATTTARRAGLGARRSLWCAVGIVSSRVDPTRHLSPNSPINNNTHFFFLFHVTNFIHFSQHFFTLTFVKKSFKSFVRFEKNN